MQDSNPRRNLARRRRQTRPPEKPPIRLGPDVADGTELSDGIDPTPPVHDCDRMANSVRSPGQGAEVPSTRPFGCPAQVDLAEFDRIAADIARSEEDIVRWAADRGWQIDAAFVRRRRGDLRQRLCDAAESAVVSTTIAKAFGADHLRASDSTVSCVEQTLTQWLYAQLSSQESEMTIERWLQVLKSVAGIIDNRMGLEKLRRFVEAGAAAMNVSPSGQDPSVSGRTIADRIRSALLGPALVNGIPL
ncbi:hypothetical protein [Humisphaera borealis]|uniref:Uncharacterized protein n=1 Tax=Humisphaera borealis TaxID=2807512 RepID=A0A7M2X2J4_9BACT|nr:hypothetical protein [Humisphaera borealis]QOV91642.1 hypothetical protein IPV69_09870 [Humisphaera borealis]